MSAPLPAVDLTPQTFVPDLLARHPQARVVLDRYGLRGCGGQSGPHESLGFFARMHGVAEATLLDELRSAVRSHSLPVVESAPSVADTIYRRFFTAGIAVILTVGAAWGVWLLWQIGFAGDFTGVSIHDVNAHGHAQISGWVGLFIMGFAYQALPRFWHGSLVAPRLAVASFVAMLVGILITTAAMWLHARPWAAEIALAGSLLEVLAIVTFATQLVITLRRSGTRRAPYLAFILTALVFFVLQAVFGAWHGWTTMTAGSREQLLYHVQTYQAILRDLQIHGLALFMILGVSLRLLPGLLGVNEISPRIAWAAFGLLLAGVIGECVLFLAYGWTGHHAFAGALLVPWLLLAIGSLLIPFKWRLWRPVPNANRSAKFVRAGYGWLAVSMVMLLLLPVYGVISGLPFSHAYYGAIRHAITVGFISLMIMGVAAKVVPTLNGVDVRQLSPLWGPFLLVNVGCLLRVSLQTLTDWHPVFFSVVGISGLFELTGLAWWGLHLIGIMRRGKRAERTDAPDAADTGVGASAVPARLEATHRVSEVLRWFPDAEEVLESLGFDLIRNPVLRRTVARHVTLAQAAAMRGVPLEPMLDELNRSVSAARPIGQGVTYATPLQDLLGRSERLDGMLAALGVDPDRDGSLTLNEAAEAFGVPREQMVLYVAQALVAPAKNACSGHCDECDHGEDNASVGGGGRGGGGGGGGHCATTSASSSLEPVVEVTP